MDFIAPPLKTVLFLRMQIGNGVSVHGALREYLISENDSFRSELLTWYQKKQSDPGILYDSPRFFRKQVVQTIERGLRGEPVDRIFQELESEMLEISREDMEAHMDRLPSLMLIPLMVFQLPGFLLILLGPVFARLFESLGVQ